MRRGMIAVGVALAAAAGSGAPAAADPCPAAAGDGLCRPSDPRFEQQWGMHNTGQDVNGNAGTQADADVDAPEAWNITRGSDDVVVAVVDSGIAYEHPDLAPRIWHNPGEQGAKASNGVDDDGNGYVDDWQGWDVVGRSVRDPSDGDNDPRDISGHGTHVAGIVGATGNDGVGVTGIDWRVRLMNVRVRAERSNETGDDIAEAFAYAARNGARIVNASLAETLPSQRMADVVAAHPDVLFVVAAGNQGWDLDAAGHPSFPCAIPAPNLLCVAATGRRDELAAFSNWSPGSVDVGAPGTITLSDAPALTDLSAESFETDPFAAGRFRRGATAGTNRWDRTSARHATGAFGIGSGAGAPSADTWIQSELPVSLAGRQGCEVSAFVWADADPGSGLYVQARADTAFEPATRTPAQDTPTPSGDTVAYLAGSTPGRRLRVNVSDLDGRPAVFFRFGLLTSADAGPGTRVDLDDVRVRCLGGPFSSDATRELDYLQGTSMATPVVSGIAALVLARYPETSAAALKADLLAAVDPLPRLAGRVGTGGRINAYRALARTTAGVTGTAMRVQAVEGTRNALSLAYDVDGAGVVRLHARDPWATDVTPAGGSRIVPGPRCASVTDTDGACVLFAVSSVAVDLGDLDDAVDAVDGVAERIDCGPGTDAARVEAADTVAGCESVTRADGPAAPPASADPFPPGVVDLTRPRLRVPASSRRVRLTRAGRLRLRLGPASEPARATLTLRTVRRVGRDARGRPRTVLLARRAFRVRRGGRVTVAVRLSRAERRLVRRHAPLKVRATVVLRDPAGNRRTIRFVLTVRPAR